MQGEKYNLANHKGFDMVYAKKRNHLIPVLFEVNIEKVLLQIEELREKCGILVPVEVFFIYCYSRAVNKYKHMQIYRMRRSKLILFKNVDIYVHYGEKEIHGKRERTFRNAAKKSLAELLYEYFAQDDLRDVLNTAVKDKGNGKEKEKFWHRLFKSLRNWNLSDPFVLKDLYGTVGLFHYGFDEIRRATWFVPESKPFTCSISLGSIYDCVTIVDEKPVIVRMLTLSALVDHEVVDGVPGVVFGEYLAKLLESAEGLNDLLTTEYLELTRIKEVEK